MTVTVFVGPPAASLFCYYVSYLVVSAVLLKTRPFSSSILFATRRVLQCAAAFVIAILWDPLTGWVASLVYSVPFQVTWKLF